MISATVKNSILINASLSGVWDVLINPKKIKQYLFGTDAVSDWKVGSSLIFKGVWEDKPYEDKGTILKFAQNKVLQYTYFSSFSGLEDKPENYAVITCSLRKEKNRVHLELAQKGFANEQAKTHSASNWESVLKTLKDVAEQKPQDFNKVVHFELPYENKERASAFYSNIFGWKLIDIPDSGENSMGYVMIHAAKTDKNNMVSEKGAINGGLFKREAVVKNPTVVIGVTAINDTIKKIEELGGKLITPKMPIPNGSYARVEDCEGNIIGLASMEK
jgi:predicted enzyme related to lactoylglutathione lyase